MWYTTFFLNMTDVCRLSHCHLKATTSTAYKPEQNRFFNKTKAMFWKTRHVPEIVHFKNTSQDQRIQQWWLSDIPGRLNILSTRNAQRSISNKQLNHQLNSSCGYKMTRRSSASHLSGLGHVHFQKRCIKASAKEDVYGNKSVCENADGIFPGRPQIS